MAAILVEPAERVHEHAIFRVEKSVRERDREFPGDINALCDGARGSAHR
jgi:hypothetical protein